MTFLHYAWAKWSTRNVIFVRCYYDMPLFLIITFRLSPVVPLFALIIRWLCLLFFISSARWYSMFYFIRSYPDHTSYYLNLFFVIPNESRVGKRSYLHFLHMNQPAVFFIVIADMLFTWWLHMFIVFLLRAISSHCTRCCYIFAGYVFSFRLNWYY